jgi:hypothetical protein
MWIFVAACLAGTACDIPTEPPILDHRWVLPLEVVTLDQSEVLPTEVQIAGTNYDVSVADVSASETLANLCPLCVNGVFGSTPAFQGTFSSTENLPTDLISVDIVSGSVDITITNDLSFDPLVNGGTITITLAGASGGAVLGTVTFDGAVDTMAPGSVTTRTLTLASATITAGIETTIDVDHAGGATTTIDLSQEISASAVTTSLLVSEVTVDVDGSTVSLTDETLDAGLDQDFIDGIQSGTVVLDVTNPFNVSFAGSITIGAITKPVTITNAATSTVSVVFTGQELRDILSQENVTVSGSGTISGGPSVLTPTSDFSIETTIDLLVELFGQ